MVNWFDLFIVVVIILFAYRGKKAGFTKAFLKMGSSLLSLLISMKTYPIISKYLIDTWLHTMIKNSVNSWVTGVVNIQGIADAGSSKIEDIVDKSAIPLVMKKSVIEGTTNALGSQTANADKILFTIGNTISLMVLNIIALILALILIRVLMIFLVKLLNGIVTRVPIVRSINSILGLLMGFAEGVLLVFIVSALLIFFNTGILAVFTTALKNCFFSQIFYYGNFIANAVMKT